MTDGTDGTELAARIREGSPTNAMEAAKEEKEAAEKAGAAAG